MILAETIIQLRKQAGWSQEELADKLGVSRQAISKWESAQSVPDLNRILDMSRLFGVSTDILLKDDLGPDFGPGEVPTELNDTDEPLRKVSLSEANDYISVRLPAAPKIALGVMLCILSPVLLIALSSLQELGRISLSEGQAAGIGVLILMCLVGAAVALFIINGMKLGRFSYIQEDALDTAYGVSGLARDRKENYSERHTMMLTIGIVLCVLSCVPIFVSMIVATSDLLTVLSVCILLIMIAIGVFMIVSTSIVQDTYDALLEEGDYTRQKKQASRHYGYIYGIYWLAAVAIFLLISFTTDSWDRSWIVWPIAGVGCGILAGILQGISNRRKK
ncbi:MAG: helix-turn-helix transcriptional regulator [Anaerovoracaceae bacterium]|nr:helix-turn-helix transcriptional regulator [Anaerovoracaceae bacterium]